MALAAVEHPRSGRPRSRHGTLARSPSSHCGLADSDLFRWNATSRTIEYLDTPPMTGLYQIVEGSPGEFYMGAGTHLLKYFVKAPAYYR